MLCPKIAHAHSEVRLEPPSCLSKCRDQELLEIVVPDSHIGMLRLLLWIYTGNVDNAEFQALADDVVAADRFQLLEMKRELLVRVLESCWLAFLLTALIRIMTGLCESLIQVDGGTAVHALELAYHIQCPRLLCAAVECVTLNLHRTKVEDGATSLALRYHEFASLLFQGVRDYHSARIRVSRRIRPFLQLCSL